MAGLLSIVLNSEVCAIGFNCISIAVDVDIDESNCCHLSHMILLAHGDRHAENNAGKSILLVELGDDDFVLVLVFIQCL
jgi:hypothetical protein